MSLGVFPERKPLGRGLYPTRRDVVCAGAFGLLGNVLSPVAATPTPAPKSVILLFIQRGPSHLEARLARRQEVESSPSEGGMGHDA